MTGVGVLTSNGKHFFIHTVPYLTVSQFSSFSSPSVLRGSMVFSGVQSTCGRGLSETQPTVPALCRLSDPCRQQAGQKHMLSGMSR